MAAQKPDWILRTTRRTNGFWVPAASVEHAVRGARGMSRSRHNVGSQVLGSRQGCRSSGLEDDVGPSQSFEKEGGKSWEE